MFVRRKPPVAPTQYVRLLDLDAKLDGMIVIYSLALGPGAGGCRLWTYPNVDAAYADALRLAVGMSYKNALAGLPFGGAKAVLRQPTSPFDREELFRAFGRAVERLEGAYITAQDVGTTVADMEVVAKETRHVAGLPAQGTCAGGNPSPWTARGVFKAMEAAARLVLRSELDGVTVAVQGLGSVGAELCRMLTFAGARLFIADIAADRCRQIEAELGARVVGTDAIAFADVDIFAPCALGGTLTRQAVGAMKARLVCGAANNQLADQDSAALLLERGITYVPDYVANAGGIINAASEYLREDGTSAAALVEEIGPRVTRILELALRKNLSPALVADRMAERIIAGLGPEHF